MLGGCPDFVILGVVLGRNLPAFLYSGWILIRHGRKHDIWRRGEHETAVPLHKEINEYRARAILKDTEGDK
jgi:hypothetical protein